MTAAFHLEEDARGELADSLVELRFISVNRQIPWIHLTAQANLAICVYVLWHKGVDPAFYLWTSLLTLFSAIRVRGGACGSDRVRYRWRLCAEALPGPASLAWDRSGWFRHFRF